MKKIRTRYAPSPTGYLHIGGARSALFTYLAAKSQGGEFIIRTEDTDVVRNVEGGEKSQLENLAWLGVIPDESAQNPGRYGPYRQSEKTEIYKKAGNKLLSEEKAYRCFCSKEQLDDDRELAFAQKRTPRYNGRCRSLSHGEIQKKLNADIPFTVRLKINDNDTYSWNDHIRGTIKVPGSSMTDPVIMKSTGGAMYNFANVIDDYAMKITLITRGEEHISNTPYQLAIKNALGYDWEFEYAHMSIIVNEEGKKLSKRDTETKQFIEDYRNDGYIPEAITNFIALLGWAPSDNKEIKTIEELKKQFSITRCNKAPAMFDVNKMKFLSSSYMKKMPEDEYIEFIREFADIKYSSRDEEWFNTLALTFKKQLVYAKEINELAEDLLKNHKLTAEAIEIMKTPEAIETKKVFKEQLTEIEDWTEEAIKIAINETKTITGNKGKNLFMPIRISACKQIHGPSLASVIFLIGRERVEKNLK